MATQIETAEREVVLARFTQKRTLRISVAVPAWISSSPSASAYFNGFVYLLEGAADFGANRLRASRSQIAVLGPGRALTVADAEPGTRFMLMAGKPYGETPVYNGPYVD